PIRASKRAPTPWPSSRPVSPRRQAAAGSTSRRCRCPREGDLSQPGLDLHYRKIYLQIAHLSTLPLQGGTMHRYFRAHGDYCGGRHARRHGLGGLFGGVVGGHGFGWHGFRAGRKLGGDDLQLVVLALLADKPYHGYEIMKALEQRSGGFYSPSPGM